MYTNPPHPLPFCCAAGLLQPKNVLTMGGHTLKARLTAAICLAMSNFNLGAAVVLFNLL